MPSCFLFFCGGAKVVFNATHDGVHIAIIDKLTALDAKEHLEAEAELLSGGKGGYLLRGRVWPGRTTHT